MLEVANIIKREGCEGNAETCELETVSCRSGVNPTPIGEGVGGDAGPEYLVSSGQVVGGMSMLQCNSGGGLGTGTHRGRDDWRL